MSTAVSTMTEGGRDVWRRPRVWAFLALLPMVALGLLLAGRPAVTAQETPPPAAPGRPKGAAAAAAPVLVAVVDEAQEQRTLTLSGSARATRSAQLMPAVAGEVASVNFRPGQAVRAGQVLVQLVDRSQRLALQLAEVRLAQAKQLLARYETTRGSGAVPAHLIDEAESDLRLAEIELAQAREAVAERVLRAPFAGVVGLPGAEPGERVGTDTVLVTVDDRRSLQVEFELPEVYLPRVQPGTVLQARNPGFPGRVFEGRVLMVDSRVDPVTRSVRVRADVPNRDDALRPGMSLQVSLPLPGRRYTRVPELALQRDRGGAYVWVVRDERAVQVPVLPVLREAEHVLVDGALRVGEKVVVEGQHSLRDGLPVVVIGQATAPATSDDPGARAAARPTANADR